MTPEIGSLKLPFNGLDSDPTSIGEAAAGDEALEARINVADGNDGRDDFPFRSVGDAFQEGAVVFSEARIWIG